jgi:hypothetical protein
LCNVQASRFRRQNAREDAQSPETFYERQDARKIRLGEIRICFAPIVFPQLLDSFASHRARQKP